VQVQGSDLSARDNAALAVAISTVTGALLSLREAGLIDDAELLRMAYRFGGEVVNVDRLLEAARRNGPRRDEARGPEGQKPAAVKIDSQTGEEKGLPAA
jgi:DNA-binding transcriptional ArsR family regulator